MRSSPRIRLHRVHHPQAMSEPFAPGVGSVLSADIAVPEHEREVGFYSRVLSTGEKPLWREEDLTNNLGIPIIGLGARSEEYAHLPLQWMPHIQVEDVARGVQVASERGGVVLMHASDDDGASQWAVLQDPHGAAFGIIPIVAVSAIPPIDGSASPEPPEAVGRIAWLDLTVPPASASATRDFYRAVICWSVQDVEMEDGDGHYADFNMVGRNGSPVAGICNARGVNAGMPPVWMIYLPVGDLGESIRRVTAGGGRVVRTVQRKDRGYAYAAIQDPVGAYLALVPG
jgi:uncharacterized protein